MGEIARELVADPKFQRAVALVANGLMAAPSLNAKGLQILRQATTFADPEAVAA